MYVFGTVSGLLTATVALQSEPQIATAFFTALSSITAWLGFSYQLDRIEDKKKKINEKDMTK